MEQLGKLRNKQVSNPITKNAFASQEDDNPQNRQAM